MSDRIEFTGADGNKHLYWPGNIAEIKTSGSRQAYIRNCGGTPDLIDEDFGAVCAKIGAAIHPAGPSDVTVRQIKEALKPLQPAVSSVVTVEIFSEGVCLVRDIDDKELAGGHDILATLASLMPKPAPDPHDELQEFVHSCLLYLKGVKTNREIDHKATNRCDELLARAEKLKEKP